MIDIIGLVYLVGIAFTWLATMGLQLWVHRELDTAGQPLELWDCIKTAALAGVIWPVTWGAVILELFVWRDG